eukprot:12884286-Prorocentrum_lima.AAC.1
MRAARTSPVINNRNSPAANSGTRALQNAAYDADRVLWLPRPKHSKMKGNPIRSKVSSPVACPS